MCERVVEEDSWSLVYVSDRFKKEDMCKGVRFHPWLIGHVHDQYITQEMCNEAVELDPSFLQYVPNWFAWHPSRWWDWCMSEDEKQETEKLWA